jgi:hypothetical protein
MTLITIMVAVALVLLSALLFALSALLFVAANDQQTRWDARSPSRG